jgi:hypothetical protein
VKHRLFLVLSLVLVASACTDAGDQVGSLPASPRPTIGNETSVEAEIYSAVVRRLVTKDHTFGRAASPFEHVYVIDGAIADAGDPRAVTAFGPAPREFETQVIAGIRRRLKDLGPLDFITDPDSVRRGKQRLGGVKNEGVIISLGPIEQLEPNEVHVSSGLWCGGTCGQWLTYVVREQHGRWNVIGTTGPSAIS